jgi:uncharacterized protein YndB with AHSA1/START domain
VGSYDIAMQVDVAATPDEIYRALSTTDGVAGWWTTRNETTGQVGGTDRFWFPQAPQSWDMRVDVAEPGKVLGWHCVGGPAEWVDTDVRWTLQPAAEGGTRVVFDHTGFKAKDEMLRVVTLGWAQMLLRLKEYTETRRSVPFFAV